MTANPQKARKMEESLEILTGERGDALDKAVRFRDLENLSKLSASARASTGVLRTDLDGLTTRVASSEGTIDLHTTQIADHETRIDAIEALPPGGILSGDATITLATACFEWRGSFAAAGVTGTSRVQVWLAPEDDDEENSPEMLDVLTISATPSAGSVALIITFSAKTSGPIKLLWSAI